MRKFMRLMPLFLFATLLITPAHAKRRQSRVVKAQSYQSEVKIISAFIDAEYDTGVIQGEVEGETVWFWRDGDSMSRIKGPDADAIKAGDFDLDFEDIRGKSSRIDFKASNNQIELKCQSKSKYKKLEAADEAEIERIQQLADEGNAKNYPKAPIKNAVFKVKGTKYRGVKKLVIAKLDEDLYPGVKNETSIYFEYKISNGYRRVKQKIDSSETINGETVYQVSNSDGIKSIITVDADGETSFSQEDQDYQLKDTKRMYVPFKKASREKNPCDNFGWMKKASNSIKKGFQRASLATKEFFQKLNPIQLIKKDEEEASSVPVIELSQPAVRVSPQ